MKFGCRNCHFHPIRQVLSESVGQSTKPRPSRSLHMNSRVSVRSPIPIGMPCMVCGLMVTMVEAAPVFWLPSFVANPPSFQMHLNTTGPNSLTPGDQLGPIYFSDNLDSLDFHHWELEFHNPTKVPMAFNLLFSTPGGVFLGNASMLPNASIYLSLVYPDVDSPFSSNWQISGGSDSAMLGELLIDTDVFEYALPVNSIAGIVAAGTTLGSPFATGLTIPNAPSLDFTIAIIPEPSTVTLLGLLFSAGLLSLLRGKAQLRR